MKKESKEVVGLFLRYIFLVLIVLPGLDIFYAIFLPLTKYPAFYFLQLFFSSNMVGNSIFIGSKVISIIDACVAGSAYYFLLILNLATPKIKALKRVKMILFAFISFLIVNIIRIVFLSFIYINNSPSFEVLHKTFWYLGGTLLVVFIWFLEVKIFRIEGIPFYSDLKKLYRSSRPKKNSKR